ncbi:MAG: hypothetical protein H8E84_05290 [Flavobacteriales bacterium]|nr:hypothetical protein [Flavobacteriales bacterium]
MIEFKILALLSPNGFDDRFWKNCKSEKTYKAAYEKTEKEFEEHFGKRKYSDYNSYRGARDKRIKRQKSYLT